MWLLFFLIGSFIFFFSAIYTYANAPTHFNRKKIFPLKIKALTFWIIAFICIIISSLRYPKEGTDTYAYKILFESITNSDDIFSLHIEYGFLIFSKLISFISSNFIFYLFIINIFIWISVYNFLSRYSFNIRYSLWLFLFMGYLDTSMCLIRQYMALAILLYAYKYIIQQKFSTFLIITLIATSFHTTALIFIIAYFTYSIKINKKSIIIYTICCILTFIITDVFYSFLELLPIYSTYLNNPVYGIQESAKLAPILNFLILYTISIFCLKYNSNYQITLLMLGSFFFILSFKFTQIGRIATYFSIYSIILLPTTIKNITNKKQKEFYTIFFFLLFLARYVIIAFFRPEWTGVYPYKFCFL